SSPYFNQPLPIQFYTHSLHDALPISFFDPAGMNPDGIPGSLAFAGSGSACQPACYGAEYPEKAWRKGFAPRLSIAYAYDPKTVVRAGYGVFLTQAFYQDRKSTRLNSSH